MSLLLDALKKAAEKKARQAEEANAESDVTVEHSQLKDSYGFSEDNTLVSEDGTTVYEDKTEQTEHSTLVVEDRTELDDDQTDLSQHDGTEVYEDKTGQTEHSTLVVEDRTELDDDQTDLSQHDGTEVYEDESEFEEDDTQLSDDVTIIQAATDETEVKEFTDETEVTEFVDQIEVTEFTDQTGFNAGDHEEEQQDTDYRTGVTVSTDDTLLPSFNEEKTITQLSNREVSDFLGDSSDNTVEATATSIDVDATEIPEDLSLYLVEGEDGTTNESDDTTIGGAHIKKQADDIDGESLQTVDYGRAQDEQTSTITSDQNPTVTATAGIELDSLRHEHTIIRPDATSTHTYAPDNYDRTLIRPPNDDVSKIFAGMKSEEDVLMTPDYAKRVFLSKSSAIRFQHNKIYLGIAISILLVIGIFSLFQLQEEYNRIDSTLLPLKRDPKPGILTTVDIDGKSSLFENNLEPNIDTQTLKIVESAGLASQTEETEVQDAVKVESTGGADGGAQTTEDQSKELEIATVAAQSIDSAAEQASGNTTNIAVDSPSAKRKPDEQVSGNLQITSNSRITEKDEWLAEAYSAYQKGDDKTALAKYLKVLEIDPANRNALLARAAIAVQNGDTASAIRDYQQLLVDNPKDSLAMSSLISVANTVPGKTETQLKLMLRDEPDSPHLNFVLANIYAVQNRWQEAQSLYFKALENNPKDPNYAYNLAVSLEHIAKPEVAITYYERAISNIENGLATFNKAVVDHRIEMLRQL